MGTNLHRHSKDLLVKTTPSEDNPAIGNTIFHTTYTFLEAVKKKPDLTKVINRLKVFSGFVSTDMNNDLTTPELLDTFQASELELRHYMASINAVELNGKWWLLDLQYLKTILNLILLTDIEMDLQNRIEYAGMKDHLREHLIPDEILLHCLTVHSKGTISGDVYEICIIKASRTVGHALLAQAVTKV
jgi:hypothetical protein